jgi:hypothetical protein
VVAAEPAEPQPGADIDRRDVAHADRRALLGGDDDVLDVVRGLDQAETAHDERVLPLGDVASAGVGVVGGDRVEHMLQGQVVGPEPIGVDDDLILLGPPAPGHHATPGTLRNSRSSSQS